MLASPRSAHQRGFTLLEVCLVAALMGIVMSVAIPSYAHFLARQQLRLAADTLALQLRQAREYSVSAGVPTFVSYRTGKAWCWGVGSGVPCDCNRGDCAMGSARSSQYPAVQLDGAVDVAFERQLGRALQFGAARMSTAKGQRLRVEVNALGRTQICGPDAPRAAPC